MKILHVINTLAAGGAQSVLAQNLEHWPGAEDRQLVICLTGRGPLSARIEALGVQVIHLAVNASKLNPFKFLQMTRAIRSFKPDVVQTWLYHSDLIGGLASRLVSRAPLVWGVHHTLGDARAVKKTTRRVVRALARLSRILPQRIICCADSALETHVAEGYHPQKMSVVYNGVDTIRFQPNQAARAEVREELGLPEKTRLVGMFARFHRQKDFATLAHAAGILAEQFPQVHFVLAGKDVDEHNGQLRAWLKEAGVQARMHLLGLRADMPRLMAAMDIVTLSAAYGEALPLVLCEAMACGVPCVATDVGDSASVIGETGRVAPREDAQALAQGWAEILNLAPAEYDHLGQLARARVVDKFNLTRAADGYRQIYSSLVTGRDIH